MSSDRQKGINTKNKNNRFSGEIGKDYKLFRFACPYYDEMHKCIAYIIRLHFASSTKQVIHALDIGTGHGDTAMYAANADSRIVVESVDNELVMIERARINLADFIAQDRVRLKHQDALHYLESVDDESIDCFVSAITLHNFDKQYRCRFLSVLYSKLSPCALFVNADKYAQDGEEHFKSLVWQISQYFQQYIPIGRLNLAEQWTLHDLEDSHEIKIMKTEDSIAQMRMNGFRNVRIVYRQHLHAIMVAEKYSK